MRLCSFWCKRAAENLGKRPLMTSATYTLHTPLSIYAKLVGYGVC